MNKIEQLIDKIMKDLVSVNPTNVAPFPYYPPYIRSILEKHLKEPTNERVENIFIQVPICNTCNKPHFWRKKKEDRCVCDSSDDWTMWEILSE